VYSRPNSWSIKAHPLLSKASKYSQLLSVISYTMSSSFLYSLLLIFIFTSQLTTATTDTANKFQYFCDQNNNGGNYTTNSTYHKNLNTLLSTLTSNKEINYGFYNSSYGNNSDKVNAIGLCRGDIKPNDCQNCLKNSTVLLTQHCQNRKEAIGWYDDEKCMLRYSNRSIFGLDEIGPAYFVWNTNNATNEVEFNKVVKKLLDSLRSRAASGDSDLKYAVGSDLVGPNNNQTIYGLVQCTPDLSKTLCDNCLVQSIKEISNCCNNRLGVRIVRPSCNLRYETNSLFYQTTSSDSPAPSPVPVPVPSFSTPPPIAQNNTSSQGIYNIKLVNRSIENFTYCISVKKYFKIKFMVVFECVFTISLMY
jgi:hypothetical protein